MIFAKIYTTCSRLIYDYQVCPSVNAFRNMRLFSFFPLVFLRKSLWIKISEALSTCAASSCNLIEWPRQLQG